MVTNINVSFNLRLNIETNPVGWCDGWWWWWCIPFHYSYSWFLYLNEYHFHYMLVLRLLLKHRAIYYQFPHKYRTACRVWHQHRLHSIQLASETSFFFNSFSEATMIYSSELIKSQFYWITNVESTRHITIIFDLQTLITILFHVNVLKWLVRYDRCCNIT